MHRFDVKTIKNVELRRKTFKTTQNYESHQTTMNCIDLMSKTSNQRKTTKVISFRWICINLTSKRSKTLRYVAKHSKQRKTTKLIKLQWIASIWCQNYQKCWVTSQNIQNNAKLRKWSNYNELHRFDVKTITITQNYESDQIIMHCINLTSKRSKKLSYVPKLQKWSHYNELHRFDVKTIKNVEVRRKTFKTTQNYKRNQITMNFIDLTSERSKMLSYVAKLQMWSYFDEFASIWRQNDNNSKLRKWSNYNELYRFDVKTITITQNYESDQIIMHCINLTSKRSKKLSYVPKLQKWSHYNELHRFDVKTIKNVEVRRKTFKTTQNYKRNQITMNFIDLTSERSKMLSYVAKLQMWSYFDEFASIWRQNDNNNSKLRKWSNYNALHQFDV